MIGVTWRRDKDQEWGGMVTRLVLGRDRLNGKGICNEDARKYCIIVPSPI